VVRLPDKSDVRPVDVHWNVAGVPQAVDTAHHVVERGHLVEVDAEDAAGKIAGEDRFQDIVLRPFDVELEEIDARVPELG
jgi:hypothetical protein